MLHCEEIMHKNKVERGSDMEVMLLFVLLDFTTNNRSHAFMCIIMRKSLSSC